MKIAASLAAVLIVFLVAAAQYFTIFVIPPIGALPEGRTLIVARINNKMNAIDSADGICERTGAGVSLMCRAVATAAVLDSSKVVGQFAYIDPLYLISTNGKRYER